MSVDLKDEPNESNSHEKNVKIAVDSIIGRKTKLRKVKKSADEKRRDTFAVIISALEKAEVNEVLLKEEFGINLVEYNDVYHDAIDGLLSLLFNERQLNFIEFYLCDRLDEEGAVRILEMPNGENILLGNPFDLWEFLKKFA